jgi:hypothetical protein
MKSTIYIGDTRTLEKPIAVNGKLYLFAFDSETPDKVQLAYRIMGSSEPNALTDEELLYLLGTSRNRRLMADLEWFENRPISWITIFPEENGGATGSGRRGQFDRGPTLEKTKTLAPQEERSRTLGKTPERLPPAPKMPYHPSLGQDRDMF